MKGTRLFAILLVLATSTFVYASGGKESTEKLRIGAVYLDNQGFYGGIAKGIQNGAGSNKIDLISANSSGDAAKEASFMSTLITSKVQAIVMSPVSATGSISIVKQAIQAGIPVVCYNSSVDNPQDVGVYALVTTDQTAFGEATGKAAATYFKKIGLTSPKIGMLNCNVYEACQERQNGFKSALSKELPGAQFVADQQGFAPDTAATVATDELTAHPDLDAVWTSNEGGTTGAMTAVKTFRSSHPSTKTVVFGSDIDTQIANFLLSDPGVLIATDAQNPQEMGRQAILQALNAIKKIAVKDFTAYIPAKVYSSDKPDEVKAWLSEHSDGLP